jgi:enamine deaminase RidA (YjgF/YER057c/UK114 family)|tara:strand:- start:1397 stop:1726 length:330 start_codon:yes stop_codon:yes gene_type:complete
MVEGSRKTYYISGVIGYDKKGNIAINDVVEQYDQTLKNIQNILKSFGGTFKDIVRMNTYIVPPYYNHKDALRKVRNKYFKSDFPTSTMVQVAGLANPDYLVEVETEAVL